MSISVLDTYATTADTVDEEKLPCRREDPEQPEAGRGGVAEAGVRHAVRGQGEQTFLDLVEHLVEWVRDAPLLLVALARPELRLRDPHPVAVADGDDRFNAQCPVAGDRCERGGGGEGRRFLVEERADARVLPRRRRGHAGLVEYRLFAGRAGGRILDRCRKCVELVAQSVAHGVDRACFNQERQGVHRVPP